MAFETLNIFNFADTVRMMYRLGFSYGFWVVWNVRLCLCLCIAKVRYDVVFSNVLAFLNVRKTKFYKRFTAAALLLAVIYMVNKCLKNT